MLRFSVLQLIFFRVSLTIKSKAYNHSNALYFDYKPTLQQVIFSRFVFYLFIANFFGLLLDFSSFYAQNFFQNFIKRHHFFPVNKMSKHFIDSGSEKEFLSSLCY